MLSDIWSKTGYGRRTPFTSITCLDKDNLFNCSSSSRFWAEDAQHEDMIEEWGNGNLCLTAKQNSTYIKWVSVEPNTLYFLNFMGKTMFPVWTDFNFGIVDSEGLAFRNFHTKHEKSFFVTDQGFDQMLTVRGQDGEWYPNIYSFYTGKNERVGFFADSTTGTVILKDIRLYKAVDAISTRETSTIINYKEDINDCDFENNYLGDLSYFEKFDYFNTFVFHHANEIKYINSGKGCCYFAWLSLKQGIYTFSFKSEVIEKGGAVYGFVSENSDGKRKWLISKTANEVNKEEIESHIIAVTKGERIAFAVFDGGGKIFFSDIRVFLYGNGKQNLKK